VPTRSSVYSDPEFRKAQYDYMKEVVNSWRAWSFMVPLDCKTSRFDADWNQAVHRVLVGGMTPKDAMAEAEKAFMSRQ
jgi:ABC-type glycerol-3-phosphate transport system substrate-binding protein